MTNKKFTFVCISEDERPIRQFSVSTRMLRFAPSLTAAAVTVVAALAMLIFIDGSARLEVAKLQVEKSAISREVESIRTRVAQMEGSIDGFIENDERFRILAGLSPIDAEIFEVGVGGPGLTTPVSGSMWETDPMTAEAVFATAYDLGALERRATLLSRSMAEAMESLFENCLFTSILRNPKPARGYAVI